MTNEEAIANLNMIGVAFVDPVTKEQRKLIDDTLDTAIKALEQQPSDTVSRGAFEQVMWERDVAIGQLKELGYGLGQKVEPCDDAISRQAVLDRIRESIETYHNQYTTDMLNMWGLFTQFIKEMPSARPQEPIDAISRDAALEKMADYVASGYADSAEDFEEYSRIICQLPSVTPQQKYGKWIDDGWYADGHSHKVFHCSECGHNVLGFKEDLSKFCPNCGAKMRGAE